MNNNNTAGEVRCGVCGREIDPNDWHQCTPSPEPAKPTAKAIMRKYITLYDHDYPTVRLIDAIEAMEEFAVQETAEKDKDIERLRWACDQVPQLRTELTRLRTLIKQVFDLEYDHLGWCEFEKQALNVPPTDTPPLP